MWWIEQPLTLQKATYHGTLLLPRAASDLRWAESLAIFRGLNECFDHF